MTDTTERDASRRKHTLGEVSHTNPYTGRVFGDTQTYGRGKTVVVDGGEAEAVDTGASGPDTDAGASDADADDNDADASENGDADADADGDDAPERLEDVDHTPPGETEGAQSAYDRGTEDE